jgi:hypothetical protein
MDLVEHVGYGVHVSVSDDAAARPGMAPESTEMPVLLARHPDP